MPARRTRLTDRDRMVLAFAAEHRLVLRDQLEALTGTDVSDRMRQLVRSGHLRDGDDLALRYYQILKAGLAAIGSTLEPPRSKLDTYRHDVGVAWLWLAARRRAFGPLDQVLSERRVRSYDGALDHPPDPYGVRLGGCDRFGNESLHYPDLLLVDHHGRRLALELELTQKGQRRLERILGAYGTDGRIDRVLYVVEDDREGRRVGGAVASTAAQMGLSPLVQVQRIKPIRTTPRGAYVAPSRPPRPRRMPAPQQIGTELDR